MVQREIQPSLQHQVDQGKYVFHVSLSPLNTKTVDFSDATHIFTHLTLNFPQYLNSSNFEVFL